MRPGKNPIHVLEVLSKTKSEVYDVVKFFLKDFQIKVSLLLLKSLCFYEVFHQFFAHMKLFFCTWTCEKSYTS